LREGKVSQRVIEEEEERWDWARERCSRVSKAEDVDEPAREELLDERER
jgi:hypothetical protein